MQLLAVAYGGTLHQHLPDLLGRRAAPAAPGRLRRAPGAVRARLARGDDLRRPAAEVNSYHHQAVADPGRLTVTGWADDDVIEAVEDPARRFVVGVQWHPEAQGDVRPFAALVEAA